MTLRTASSFLRMVTFIRSGNYSLHIQVSTDNKYIAFDSRKQLLKKHEHCGDSCIAIRDCS